VDLTDTRATTAEQPGEPLLTYAPHRIDQHTEPGIADRLGLNELADALEIALVGIKELHKALALGAIVVQGLYASALLRGEDALFDLA